MKNTKLDRVELQMIAESLRMEILLYENNGQNQAKKHFLWNILEKVNKQISDLPGKHL